MPFGPSKILQKIPPTEIREYLYVLESVFQTMKTVMKLPAEIRLDIGILKHCVDSYFCDLLRMKGFHEIDIEDRHKRAAFTIKWITRLRPIQICSDAQLNKSWLLVNELFAVFAGLKHLPVTFHAMRKDLYLRNLLYTLHNRNLDVEVLSSMMFLIEKGYGTSENMGVSG